MSGLFDFLRNRGGDAVSPPGRPGFVKVIKQRLLTPDVFFSFALIRLFVRSRRLTERGFRV